MWENYEELEEKLTLNELMETLSASREKEHRQNKFLAALKGINIDEGEENASMERVHAEMARIEAEIAEGAPKNTNTNPYAAFGVALVEEE